MARPAPSSTDYSDDDRAGLFSTSTPAGWAAILAAGGFVLLVLSLAEGRAVSGIVKAIQFLLVLAAGEAVIHYLVRQKSLRHPESAFWGGAGLDW